MNIHERFILVMADLMKIDISNSDPMRFSKRSAIHAANDALEHGVAQAERFLRVIEAIESDVKDAKKP